MKSKRPYMLRAIYDWIWDSQQTPYIIVDAKIHNVMVPQHLVKDGFITLNISSNAVRDLKLGDDVVTFSTRFNGVQENIYVPIQAVTAIYAAENNDGVIFPHEDIDQEIEEQDKPKRQKPNLRIVH